MNKDYGLVNVKDAEATVVPDDFGFFVDIVDKSTWEKEVGQMFADAIEDEIKKQLVLEMKDFSIIPDKDCEMALLKDNDKFLTHAWFFAKTKVIEIDDANSYSKSIFDVWLKENFLGYVNISENN